MDCKSGIALTEMQRPILAPSGNLHHLQNVGTYTPEEREAWEVREGRRKLHGRPGGCTLLQGHAPQPWTAHSPVYTCIASSSIALFNKFSASMLVDCKEALDDAWGGCTKGGCGWVRRASMAKSWGCKHGASEAPSFPPGGPCARTWPMPVSPLLHDASGAVVCGVEGNAASASSAGELLAPLSMPAAHNW
jgi:hypothetical protein